MLFCYTAVPLHFTTLPRSGSLPASLVLPSAYYHQSRLIYGMVYRSIVRVSFLCDTRNKKRTIWGGRDTDTNWAMYVLRSSYFVLESYRIMRRVGTRIHIVSYCSVTTTTSSSSSSSNSGCSYHVRSTGVIHQRRTISSNSNNEASKLKFRAPRCQAVWYLVPGTWYRYAATPQSSKS